MPANIVKMFCCNGALQRRTVELPVKRCQPAQRRARSCLVNPMIGSDALEKITTVTSLGGGGVDGNLNTDF